MSLYRALFTIESVGIYPNGKNIYLTVAPEIAQEKTTKLSILLERSDENLSVLAEIIRDQIFVVKLHLDPSSRETINGRNNSTLLRYKAIKIEIPCERSRLNY